MSDSAQPNDRGLDDVGSQDVVVTRSQEELQIAVHSRETRRARLNKYLEAETVTRTIPLRSEQVRIEYAPISADGDERPPEFVPAADAGAWLVLYEEEIVVQTRWVPRERVRLVTHTVTDTQEISEQVREERVELDTDIRAPVTPAAAKQTDATGAKARRPRTTKPPETEDE